MLVRPIPIPSTPCCAMRRLSRRGSGLLCRAMDCSLVIKSPVTPPGAPTYQTLTSEPRAALLRRACVALPSRGGVYPAPCFELALLLPKAVFGA
jgi:hypothetical protein